MATINYSKRTYEFYTEDRNGNETIVATKTVARPSKCKVWKQIQKDGFTPEVGKYGYRVKETR